MWDTYNAVCSFLGGQLLLIAAMEPHAQSPLNVIQSSFFGLAGPHMFCVLACQSRNPMSCWSALLGPYLVLA